MKKKIVILFCILCASLILSEVVFAIDHSTNISQDETWDTGGNPHNILGVISVIGNATLTINPGVEVRFNPGCSLLIGITGINSSPGKLIASGTDTQKIIFTSNSPNPLPGDWNAISFQPTASDDSVIENAIIEYGGGSLGILRINGSNPTIRNCTVRYSANSGIRLDSSTAEISNCTIEDNALYGADCDGFSGALDGNLFTNNGSYPISLYSRNTPSPVVNIQNNFASNNPDQVYFNPGSGIDFDYTFINFGIPYFLPGNLNVINNATLTINPGVEVQFITGSSLLIGISNSPGRLIAIGTDTQKIIFTSNSPNPLPGDWNGIYFYITAEDDSVIENAIIEYGGGTFGNLRINGSNPTIRNCTVRYSANYGIYLTGSSAVITCSDIMQNQIGIYATLSNPTISQNNFSNNINWGIYNTSASMIINAKYNWWGDVSGPSGASTGFGDAVSEYVAYYPWFLAISDCTFCMGDFEPDGDVDGKNFAEFVFHYGCLNNCGVFDLTGDGSVNSDDLGALALYFGRNNCSQ